MCKASFYRLNSPAISHSIPPNRAVPLILLLSPSPGLADTHTEVPDIVVASRAVDQRLIFIRRRGTNRRPTPTKLN